MEIHVPSTFLGKPEKILNIKFGAPFLPDKEFVESQHLITRLARETQRTANLRRCSYCGRYYFTAIKSIKSYCGECRKKTKTSEIYCHICGSLEHTTKNCSYLKCSECGKDIPVKRAIRAKIEGTYRLCNDCGGICKKCGRLFKKSYFWQEYCPGCKSVSDFDSKTKVIAMRRPNGGGTSIFTKSWSPFSFELEVYATSSATFDKNIISNSIKRGTDGSIKNHGFGTAEFRLGPYYGDYGLKILHDDVAKIRYTGWRADDSCGLHMHIDASNKESNIQNLLNLFFFYQEALYSLTKYTRRGNRYCYKYEKPELSDNRYMGLNTVAYETHGTIEYRFPAGTANPERVSKWAQLLLSFTEAGFGFSYSNPISLSQIMGNNRQYWDMVYKIQKEISVKNGVDTKFDGNFDAKPTPTAENMAKILKIESLEDLKELKKKIKSIETELKEELKCIYTFESPEVR